MTSELARVDKGREFMVGAKSGIYGGLIGAVGGGFIKSGNNEKLLSHCVGGGFNSSVIPCGKGGG